jgi:hypothetical protein
MSASSIGAIAGTAVLPGVGTLLGFQAGLAKESLDETKKARQAQEKLEAQRRKQLDDEAAAREAAATKAAGAGSRVGLRASFQSALGFGTGNTQQGLGAGTLFGN